jgi:hypothetical protein
LGPVDGLVGTVYNALPVDGWPYTTEKDDYLLAFGRICRQGLHLAIGSRAARATSADGRRRAAVACGHFHERIEPEIDGDRIVYLGEVPTSRSGAVRARPPSPSSGPGLAW